MAPKAPPVVHGEVGGVEVEVGCTPSPAVSGNDAFEGQASRGNLGINDEVLPWREENKK